MKMIKADTKELIDDIYRAIPSLSRRNNCYYDDVIEAMRCIVTEHQIKTNHTFPLRGR